jgi:hypothetical protein
MENQINFVQCPNHEDNVKPGTLHFVAKDTIECELCKKQFSLSDIQIYIMESYESKLFATAVDFHQKTMRMQEDYHMDMARLREEANDDLITLQEMNETFKS